MSGLVAAIGPRILIPGFFIGPKLIASKDYVNISQNLALTFLFTCFAVVLFSENAWLAVIPGIASWSYWNMLRDTTNLEFYRYMDWAMTTPLMLVGILVANGSSTASIFTTVILDLIMIGTGYLGAIEKDDSKKRTLFALGCLAFLPIIYIILGMKKAKYAIYLTLIMWTLYPLVWYADEENLVSKNTANISYSIMDTIAKVGLVNLLNV
jgi:bacteriorhodopsin